MICIVGCIVGWVIATFAGVCLLGDLASKRKTLNGRIAKLGTEVGMMKARLMSAAKKGDSSLRICPPGGQPSAKLHRFTFAGDAGIIGRAPQMAPSHSDFQPGCSSLKKEFRVSGF